MGPDGAERTPGCRLRPCSGLLASWSRSEFLAALAQMPYGLVMPLILWTQKETWMAHPLVDQLRFTRGEFVRALEGVPPEDGSRRLLPMNSISWIVGHMASHEDSYWNLVAQGKPVAPRLRELAGYGKPATTPDLAEMWAEWRAVTTQADQYLDNLTNERLSERFQWKGKTFEENIGTMMHRVIYHYWYHLGETQAIRQLLGHKALPEFVGNMSGYEWRPQA